MTTSTGTTIILVFSLIMAICSVASTSIGLEIYNDHPEYAPGGFEGRYKSNYWFMVANIIAQIVLCIFSFFLTFVFAGC